MASASIGLSFPGFGSLVHFLLAEVLIVDSALLGCSSKTNANNNLFTVIGNQFIYLPVDFDEFGVIFLFNGLRIDLFAAAEAWFFFLAIGFVDETIISENFAAISIAPCKKYQNISTWCSHMDVEKSLQYPQKVL
jgi:hypothetical protein